VSSEDVLLGPFMLLPGEGSQAPSVEELELVQPIATPVTFTPPMQSSKLQI
jgi:hypothetical protein